ncbi:hypothetical protein DRH29_00210 [candidate division Kazan bacterium]|uniref:UDP-N-acetylenolpyruvoylglucosamine reductase n=1 Tax=candidate division Kazan bacterium TaxID=2202143 RepID=A0A420ZDK1_UNCK3|nr:MAG: hypothetical protein DRH29_00210 [candidate division Kazan bacterium]
MTVATLGIQKEIKLADRCRFGVGGPADFFVEVTAAEDIKAAIMYALDHNLDYFIYGEGSNLFFDDKGFRGLVIRISGGKFEVSSGGVVRVDAGYSLPKLVRDLAEKGWGGLEFLGNIPGSIGGAVVGNAGCYGKAIKDVLIDAQVYSVKQNKIEEWKPKDFEFDYRHSKIKYDPDKIILSVNLKAVKRSPSEIVREIEQELNERKSKHPHTAKCAGSFFKNPKEMAAWKAITDAGMADANVGGAAISPKHANFLVNSGGATSEDILKLARMIQKEVSSKLGIQLEPEVRYVGEFSVRGI